jgi:hypothetical protein
MSISIAGEDHHAEAKEKETRLTLDQSRRANRNYPPSILSGDATATATAGEPERKT